jgi:uroporphyrinogen decarboxylase
LQTGLSLCSHPHRSTSRHNFAVNPENARLDAWETHPLSEPDASAIPGSDGKQAEPLVEFNPFDGPNRSMNSGADPDGPNRAVTTAEQTADPPAVSQPATAAGANGSRFLRACLRLPTDRTPVWFLRQAGRYMPEYMAVRKHHSLLDICRTPDIAAEVTITAAERLGVDAAIIFADLLLPFTPMGLDFEFVANEGPVVHAPIRTSAQARALRTDSTDDLRYVARAIEKVAAHFAPKGPSSNPPLTGPASKEMTGAALKGATGAALKGVTGAALKGTGFSPSIESPGASGALAPEGTSQDQLGIIGFCGAPFTLASYMIEGGSSRNYIETKRLMYASAPTQENCHPERSAGSKDLRFDPAAHPESSAWPILMDKLLTVLTEYAAQQVEAGAQVIQVFDSWVGALSISDYRDYVLAPTTQLIRRIKALGVPVIYFGVDTASLLPAMRETGCDVLGLDWRTPLDLAWRTLHHAVAVQGNLDPITLFAPPQVLHARVAEILAAAAHRPGHIFNLGHGIVPTTPVDAVLQVVHQIKHSA